MWKPWLGKAYHYLVAIELLALVPICALTVAWLWFDETARLAFYPTIRIMTRTASFIVLAVLLETLALHLYKKYGRSGCLTVSAKWWNLFLRSLVYLFVALWIINFWRFWVFSKQENLRRSSDLYVAYMRPGAWTIWLSEMAAIVVGMSTAKKSG